MSGQASDPDPLDTEGWPTRDGDWAAYIAKREREEVESRDFRAGSEAATEAFARLHAERDRLRAIDEFSDAELIAELARRLTEARRTIMPSRERED